MPARRRRTVVAGVLATAALAVMPWPAAAASVVDTAASARSSAVTVLVSGAVAAGVDRTTTARARASRAYRRSIPLPVWVRSPMALKVVRRESGGNCRIVGGGGRYMGKWQLDTQEWRRYGGTAFAPKPHRATCSQQDVVAYRSWVDRGWTPWSTAY